jgi:hypothetical protein
MVVPFEKSRTSEMVRTSPTGASILANLTRSPGTTLCWNPPLAITEYMEFTFWEKAGEMYHMDKRI